MKRHAFTLVELLVVISIIALLIALTLPALRQARASAMAIKCLSNQQQLFLPVLAYVNDHRDHIPYMSRGEASFGGGSNNSGWLNRMTRVGGLSPYNDRAPGIRSCPEVGSGVAVTTTQNAQIVNNWGHFAMPLEVTAYVRYDQDPPRWINGAQTWYGKSGPPHRLSLFLKPTISAAIVDALIYTPSGSQGELSTTSLEINGFRWRVGMNSPMTTGSPMPATPFNFRHLANSANISFLDGHGERRTYDAGNYNGFGKLVGPYGTRVGDL